MSVFKNIVLLKAHQEYEVPQPQYVSDLIEVCGIAAAVEEDVESVKIPVDFYTDGAYEGFDNYIKNNPVDLVAISSMTGAYMNALKIAELSKRSGKYVVLGGYHPSALPEEVLQSPFVDAVVIGEGELTFKELVKNGPSADVAGLAFKKDGKVVFGPPRPVIKDLDALPFPLRKARPQRFNEAGDQYSIDTVYASRGCPYTCTFCANEVVNKRWRARSPENIVEELASIYDPQRIKTVKLWDANFLTNVKRIEKLCDLIIERKWTNFKFNVETSADDIIRAEAIMPKLRQAGILHVGIGIESPNEETLKLMRKKAKGDTCAKAVEILNRNKIKAQGFFIIGHYIESEEQTKQYPLYAQSLGLRQAVFMVMTPYPGTDVFKEYRDGNKIKNNDWSIYNNFGTAVETESMNTLQLKGMFSYCWGGFYTRFAFTNNSKPLGVAANVIQKMAMLYQIYQIDKTNSREDIKNFLFKFLEAALGEYSRKPPKKSSLTLKIFKEFTFRFYRSPREAIDLVFKRSAESYDLKVVRVDGSSPFNGMSIDIEDIALLAERVTPNMLVNVASQFEIAKSIIGNSALKRKKYLSFLYDPIMLKTVFNLLRSMSPTLLRGSFSYVKNFALR